MLYVNKIILTQFKNYTAREFRFTQRIVGICGLNGKGKTNLLDAIHYLCFTKSYFSKTDTLNVQFGSDGFRVEANLTQTITNAENAKEGFSLILIYRGAGKKEILMNDVLYEKFSAHIGKFPCVMIAPDDIELIIGVSEERRKFIDTVISQMDAAYLQHLITYTKVLQQRNSLLKQFAENGNVNLGLLEVLDQQLIQPGKEIHQKRRNFNAQLIPLVKKFYHQIADNNETIDLIYLSNLNENSFEDLLKRSREKDMILQRTNVGIHKDDLEAQLDGRSFKNTASQGQRKSLLFALKLAEFELLKQNKGFAPLLLLDDVFEKLDESRMQKLLEWVCANNNGQVFITDTHCERLTTSLNNFAQHVQVIQLD